MAFESYCNIISAAGVQIAPISVQLWSVGRKNTKYCASKNKIYNFRHFSQKAPAFRKSFFAFSSKKYRFAIAFF